jgi:hypothetical protein
MNLGSYRSRGNIFKAEALARYQQMLPKTPFKNFGAPPKGFQSLFRRLHPYAQRFQISPIHLSRLKAGQVINRRAVRINGLEINHL